MSKPRSAAADYLVYLVARIFVCVIQSISLDAARRLAGVLAWLVYRVDRRHREAAAENLRHAFPDRFAHADPDPLVRAVYRRDAASGEGGLAEVQGWEVRDGSRWT